MIVANCVPVRIRSTGGDQQLPQPLVPADEPPRCIEDAHALAMWSSVARTIRA
jgi:hypothetical protein